MRKLNRVEHLADPDQRRVNASLERNTWRVESGCLLWLGSIDPSPSGAIYGQLNALVDGRIRTLRAHRAAYMVSDDIPPGLDVDHLCRQPLCVDRDHLEAVTQAENNLRRERAGRFQIMTEGDICESHLVRVEQYSEYKGKPYFRCRPCYNEYQRDYHAARRAA